MMIYRRLSDWTLLYVNPGWNNWCDENSELSSLDKQPQCAPDGLFPSEFNTYGNARVEGHAGDSDVSCGIELY